MPRVNISVPHAEFTQQLGRHRTIVARIYSIEPGIQRLVAELVMMRLFDEFQEAVAGIAKRLACGASYLDGSAPRLLTQPARSTEGAAALFMSHGRAKSQNLRWSKAGFINDATRHVLDPSNHFTQICTAHGGIISEMQIVRNRIAHKNAKTQRAYSTIVQRHYGAPLNSVTPGLLLLTDRFKPTLLGTYIGACSTIVKDCCRAS